MSINMNNPQNPQDASHARYDLGGIKELKHIAHSVDKSVAEIKSGMWGNRVVYPTRWPKLNKNLDGGLTAR